MGRRIKKKTKNNKNDFIENLEIYPKEMTSIFETKPEIYIKYSKVVRNIELFSVRMFIDDNIVCAKVTKEGVFFQPRCELQSGQHNIRVFFRTISDKIIDIKWHFNILEKEGKYNYYFGVPHSHTSYSSGEGLPQDAFKYARKKKIDYIIITDHCRNFSSQGIIGRDKKIKDFSRWDASKYEAERFNKKNRKFLALIGFEYSSKLFGHINIYNAEEYINKRIKSNEILHEWLKKQNKVLACINHPSKKILNLSYDEKFDKYINFVEVGNGSPPFKYIRYEDIYYGLLDRGWHLGAVNGQDNHKDNWGDNNNLTVVVSKSLNKKDFYEALLNRRVYSTESRGLRITYKANECWMGSIINVKEGEKIRFNIRIEDRRNPIKKIEIITNNKEKIKTMSYKEQIKLKWNFDIISCKKHTWYVLKITHKDGSISITSPIFTK